MSCSLCIFWQRWLTALYLLLRSLYSLYNKNHKTFISSDFAILKVSMHNNQRHDHVGTPHLISFQQNISQQAMKRLWEDSCVCMGGHNKFIGKWAPNATWEHYPTTTMYVSSTCWIASYPIATLSGFFFPTLSRNEICGGSIINPC